MKVSRDNNKVYMSSSGSHTFYGVCFTIDEIPFSEIFKLLYYKLTDMFK